MRKRLKLEFMCICYIVKPCEEQLEKLMQFQRDLTKILESSLISLLSGENRTAPFFISQVTHFSCSCLSLPVKQNHDRGFFGIKLSTATVCIKYSHLSCTFQSFLIIINQPQNMERLGCGMDFIINFIT